MLRGYLPAPNGWVDWPTDRPPTITVVVLHDERESLRYLRVTTRERGERGKKEVGAGWGRFYFIVLLCTTGMRKWDATGYTWQNLCGRKQKVKRQEGKSKRK